MSTPEHTDNKAAMTTVAVLDAQDVYRGTRVIALADLQPEDVHLPDGCDLAEGQYAWNRERGTFVRHTPTASQASPDAVALSAIAVGFLSIAGLPPETLNWMRAHFSSFDFAGAGFSAETVAKVKTFLGAAS